MTQYFLTVPHDSAEEPTMASMQEQDPAELEAVFAAVGALNDELVARPVRSCSPAGCTRRRRR